MSGTDGEMAMIDQLELQLKATSNDQTGLIRCEYWQNLLHHGERVIIFGANMTFLAKCPKLGASRDK